MICQEIPSALIDAASPPPVLVVGAGPAGIVQALELRRHGIDVVMLAGGADGFDAHFQSLAEAEIADPSRHAPMGIAVRRALGGTALLWGGRCVPFDDIDFAARPHVPGGGWPLRDAGLTTMDYRQVHCPVAEAMLADGVSVPINPAMSDDEAAQTAEAVAKVAHHFAR